MSGSLHVSASAGIVATLVRGDQVVTIHKAGTKTFALGAIVRACDRYGWKVRCLSTPTTIYRDLHGSRSRTFYEGTGKRDEPDAHVQIPERALLGNLGRRDLLA